MREFSNRILTKKNVLLTICEKNVEKYSGVIKCHALS